MFNISKHLNFLLLFILPYYYRLREILLYLLTGKHEVERICLSDASLCDKTLKIESWLTKTSSKPISKFIRQSSSYLCDSSKCREPIDKILAFFNSSSNGNSRSFASQELGEKFNNILHRAVRKLGNQLCDLIQKEKQLRLRQETSQCLETCIHRIVAYRLSQVLIQRLTNLKYDHLINSHTEQLMSLWNHLVEDDLSMPEGERAFPEALSAEVIVDKKQIVSKRWSHIGFQGDDPGTDFRGMGILGLIQLEYLATAPNCVGRHLLKRTLDDEIQYPFAIAGINITFVLVNLFKSGKLRYLYYDNSRCLFTASDADSSGTKQAKQVGLFTALNEIYLDLFLRFDDHWRSSAPDSIFRFREILEAWVSSIEVLLIERRYRLSSHQVTNEPTGSC